MSGLESAVEGEVTLKFSELRRCVVCFRIFTPRRRLKAGWCKCGGGTFRAAGMIRADDVREIEEDYGWNVCIDFEQKAGCGNIEDGLLATRDAGHVRESGGAEIDETRLHSRSGRDGHRERDKERRILSLRDWWKGVPEFLRNPRGVRTKPQSGW